MAVVSVVSRLSGSFLVAHLNKLRPVVTRHSSVCTCWWPHRHDTDSSVTSPRQTNFLRALPQTSGSCIGVRLYSKKAKKEKKEKGGKGGKPKVDLTEAELNEVINYDKMCHQMSLAMDNLKKDYVEQLSLRSNQGALDQLPVATPDGTFPLQQLAQIVQVNPQMVRVNLASTPQYISAVKTAIAESGMNLSPQQDGNTLFVPLPKVTREHREHLAKNAKGLHDKTVEKLREIHNRFSRDLKKDKSAHSADLLHNVQGYVDFKMKEFISQSEALLETKRNELLGDKPL